MQILPSPIAIKPTVRSTGQSRWLTWCLALSIGSTLLLGLMRLPEPLWGDQALFLVGGQAIRDGALLYRDFWDLKQPGIYGLFALAGSLFGFTGIGIHVVDLLWMGALGLVLWRTQQSALSRSWIAALLPWLCVGTYFAVIDSRQQFQVESLVGLPLYLCVWFNVQAAQQPAKRWRWLMLSGIMASVVLLMKLVYLPMMVAFWLVYVGHRVGKQHQPLLPTLWQTSWPITIGMALPLLPVLGYWWATNTLDLALYTQLQHPAKMLRALPGKPLGHLLRAIGWAILRFWPMIGLASYAVWRQRQRLNLWTMQLIVWIGLGLGMILAQSQSWWSYHFLLLLVPISVLAAHGLDELLKIQRRRQLARGLVALAIGSLVVLNLRAATDMTQIMVRSGLPLTPTAQLQYQTIKSSLYREAVQEVALIQRPAALPGKIYVIGNPLFYLLAGRSQAVPLIGWIPELMLPEQWQQLIDQLTAAKPNYIYSNRDDTRYFHPSYQKFLDEHYFAAQTSEFGIWHQIKPTQ
jgi:hypothetical protein